MGRIRTKIPKPPVPTGYALARDDEGRTLWRIPDHVNTRKDQEFMLVEPDGSFARLVVAIHTDPNGANRLKNVYSNSEKRMPRSWILWIAREVYGDSLTSTHLGDMSYPMLPIPLKAASWSDVEQTLKTHGLNEVHERILFGDWAAREDARKDLRRSLSHILFELGIDNDDLHLPNDIVSFRLLHGDVILSVFIREHPNGDESIGYRLSDVLYTSDQEPKQVFADDLVGLLEKSESWFPAHERQDWIDQHVENPLWLFDPDVLEAYELLGSPCPLAIPWAAFSVWATEQGLEVTHRDHLCGSAW